MLRKIKDIIDSSERLLISTHIDPDGDALGSAFSLARAFESMGKEAAVYLKDPVPYTYEFLPRPSGLTHEFPHGGFDAVFIVDCGSLFRIGTGYEELTGTASIVNIDHHATNDSFGLVNMVDENACSTAELLYPLYQFIHVPISTDMAQDIYTAVLTDTGSFRYGNTNAQAFILAEKMVRLGVRPAYVSQMVYNSHPKERFTLLGLVLSELKTYNDDRIALAHVTGEMFGKAGATKEYAEGFVEFIKEIRGVETAVLLREVPGGFKVSMRSSGAIDAAKMCGLFGGGGHMNAAGCTIEGGLGEVQKKIKEALKIE